MNDIKLKLAALFRRCTSPDISDEEAAIALREFRALGATPREIDAVLAPPPTAASKPAAAPANEGPRWPFTKKHAGEPIAHIARTDPDYLRYFLSQEGERALREPLRSQVAAALGVTLPPSNDKPPF